MSEQDTEVTDAPAEETPEETTDAAAQEQPTEDDTPDWRKDFDPDKAREKITKLNSENRNLRQRAKTAEEKAAGSEEKDRRISDLETALTRERVGRRLGLPDQLVDRLKGSSEEELLADAQALVDLVSPKSPVKRRPTERLSGGGEPEEEPEETDPAKLAAAIRAARG